MPETLDPRGVRFTAGVTSVILAAALVTQSWRMMAAQTVLFGVCAFVGVKSNPWGYAFRRAVQPRLAPVDTAKREDQAPVRFSQGVGFVFAMLATLGFATGWAQLGFVAGGFALVAALLNAAFGYCLGCQIYPLVRALARTVRTGPTRQVVHRGYEWTAKNEQDKTPQGVAR